MAGDDLIAEACGDLMWRAEGVDFVTAIEIARQIRAISTEPMPSPASAECPDNVRQFSERPVNSRATRQ